MSRPFVVCYICGREYGSSSIGIHEPKCLEKWKTQNNLRPPNERLPLPVKPGVSKQSGPLGTNNKENLTVAYNEAAAMVASSNLVPCPLCDRKFNPDRLEVHKSVCKASSNRR
ncbi:unnamed protein product [Dicrocoelium dendriticum]|nr:unnamed protein product [Dicrocoelium dendriticum]